MSFKPNDKVVCVDAVPGPGTLDGEYYYPRGYLRHGQVYVVHRVYETIFAEGPCIVLDVGVPAIMKKDSGNHRKGYDVGFDFRRFRRLSEVGHPLVISQKLAHKDSELFRT